jgi:hypothetical protein
MEVLSHRERFHDLFVGSIILSVEIFRSNLNLQTAMICVNTIKSGPCKQYAEGIQISIFTFVFLDVNISVSIISNIKVLVFQQIKCSLGTFWTTLKQTLAKLGK